MLSVYKNFFILQLSHNFNYYSNPFGVRPEGNTSDSAIDNSSQSQFQFSQVDFPESQDFMQSGHQTNSQTSDVGAI